MSDHAIWSPSSADRLMTCTASIALIQALIRAGELTENDLDGDKTEHISEDDIFQLEGSAYQDVILEPDADVTSFAAEGTVMHSIREICLDMNLDPENFIGTKMSADGFSFEIDDDMADRLVEGIDWIRQHTLEPLIEIRVDLSPWWPEQFGTCDTGWVYKKTLFISDYKNGVGMPVEVVGNRQLRIYALGVWHLLGRPAVEKVVINVDQPRAGGMKFWELTLDELLEFGEEMKRVFARVQQGDVEFVPSAKACQWCPVRKTKRGCAAYNKFFIQMLGQAVADVNEEPKFIDPEQMPRAQRFYIVKHAAEIKKWLGELYSQSLLAALDGDPDPGSKAIEGNQGNRFLTDEDKAKKLLIAALGRGAFAPRKLIGFTEIDKKLKPGARKKGNPEIYEQIMEITDRPPAKPKLVPADHPKPEYNKVSDDDFDDADDLPDDRTSKDEFDFDDAD